MVHCYQA
nr:ribosomal protein S14 [Galeola lindleyana]